MYIQHNDRNYKCDKSMGGRKKSNITLSNPLLYNYLFCYNKNNNMNNADDTAITNFTTKNLDEQFMYFALIVILNVVNEIYKL